jgi:hypothetical protein
VRPFILLALLALAPALPAQDPAPSREEKAPTAEELAETQKDLGERLAGLEKTMQRIAKILEKRNPDQAARLRIALQRSKYDRNVEAIKEIESLLQERYFADAVERQKILDSAIERLIDILLDRDAERKDLQDKIDRYEDMAATISRIIEEERNHYLKSEKFADPEKTLQRAAAARSRLSDLISRQKKLIDRTKQPPGDGGAGELKKRLDELHKKQLDLRGASEAERQESLAREAAELGKDLETHARGLPDAMKKDRLGRANPADQAADAVARAAKSMQDAARSMGEKGEFEPKQREAEQDLREAADALRRLADRHKDHEQNRLATDQERLRKDAERLKKELDRLSRSAPGQDSGAGDVGEAGKEMEQAEESLSKTKRKKALPHEEKAKEKLEEAYKKLEEFEKELKRLIKLPDYEKLSKEQEDTTEKTEELLKKMKQQGGSPPQGSQPGEPTPGQQGVEGAKKAMQRAQRNLRSKSAKRANSDQKEAIERLEKAREELEEALRQLREEEQLMLLEALNRRLGRMLAKQRKIFKETLSLNIRLRDAGKSPPRALVDKGRQLGDGEAELAVEAEKLLDILKEEGTTIVIPDVVEDVKRDLDGLASRLRKLKAGPYTQEIQQDVIETLRELMEVIKEEMNRRQGGGQGQQPGEEMEGSQDENLLPTSAELKMLRSLQVRVNKRTNTFDRLVEQEDTERDRIAEKQSNVGTLTRTMADRLNREEDG